MIKKIEVRRHEEIANVWSKFVLKLGAIGLTLLFVAYLIWG